MPIYEYRCQDCGHELEVLQSMSDESITHCPVCGEDTLSKLISAAGFRLKGGGWYETDFKSKDKQRHLATSDSSLSSNKTTSAQASSETKTDQSAAQASSN